MNARRLVASDGDDVEVMEEPLNESTGEFTVVSPCVFDRFLG